MHAYLECMFKGTDFEDIISVHAYLECMFKGTDFEDIISMHACIFRLYTCLQLMRAVVEYK